MSSKNYYIILGVARSAPKEEVKKAYHSLARKYHPDNKDTGDENRFKEINEAYQTLSDDKRRAEYDAYGHVFSGAQGPTSGFDGNAQFRQDFDLGDIFSEFFGGGRGVARGRDISIDLNISFEEGVFGTERKVLLAKTSTCEPCDGHGAEKQKGFTTCSSCNGRGRVHESHTSVFGTLNSVRECGSCRGTGKIAKVKCKKCYGLGVLKKQEEVTIQIPTGIQDGEVIRLSGLGESVPHGGVSGDLYARVHVATHSVFKREGKNLLAELDIKLSDALLGVEYTLRTLDGVDIKIKIPAGISYGEKLRIRGKGIPLDGGLRGKIGGRRGDLLVCININLPKNLSRKAKKLINEIKEEGS